MDIQLNRLPPTKLTEYDTFPLASRMGFIHAIPEKDFDIAQATVTDVGFLGLFPKKILQELRAYARDIEKAKESNDEFIHLMNQLLHTFLYRSITVQKTIQILMSGFKDYLNRLDEQRSKTDSGTTCEEATTVATTTQTSPEEPPHPPPPVPSTLADNHDPPRKCYAIKCRLLQAKSILRGYKLCTANRSTCSGCSNEAAKQRLNASLEQEMLRLSVANELLEPLLQHRTQPASLKDFRKMVQFLPSLSKTSRNDHKFGAATYLANTLGILLLPTASCRIMDEPMATRQTNNLWRQASFTCRCNPATDQPRQTYGIRTFCTTCDYIIPAVQASRCPGCNTYDSWDSRDALCLSCQLATITYRNPFHKRLERLISEWLPPPTDSEDSIPAPKYSSPKTAGLSSPASSAEPTDTELITMRTTSYKNSFAAIRARSSPEQNHLVIENITMLQRDFKKNHIAKRDLTSAQSTSQQSGSLLDENFSPRKKQSTQRQLFEDDSSVSRNSLHSRQPLLPIDLNAQASGTASNSSRNTRALSSKRQATKRNRTLLMKGKKLGKENHKPH